VHRQFGQAGDAVDDVDAKPVGIAEGDALAAAGLVDRGDGAGARQGGEGSEIGGGGDGEGDAVETGRLALAREIAASETPAAAAASSPATAPSESSAAKSAPAAPVSGFAILVKALRALIGDWLKRLFAGRPAR